MGAYDKDKPSASTSLRSSNPEILANWSQLQTAIDNQHNFTGTSAGTQTGDHTQGSAITFSQASAPATRIDAAGFLSTDLGSLWTDTDDNALYVLTATVPTWTPVSTEVIATLLAANRTFLGTLDVTGTLAALGAMTVATTLDVVGNIDPTSYETTNGGFLNDDSMLTATDTSVASSDSILKFASIDAQLQLMHDSEGSFINADVNGTKTRVYTKYFTGTLDSDSATAVAHGVASGGTKILSAAIFAWNGNTSQFSVNEYNRGAISNDSFNADIGSANVNFTNVGVNLQGEIYRIKIEYIL